jgi:hypothetical protein
MIFVFATASASAGAPQLGSSPDWSSVDGAVPYGDGHAIPLEAAQPAWYTDELAARVDAANGAPVAAPNDAPLPGEIGIRPGSWMIAPAGCTMNFVFGSPGSYSIGTAGHCAANGDEVVLLTLAPGGANPVLVEVGTVLRSVDGGVGNDFALVSIRPELQSWVSPTIAIVAGPCGSYGGAAPGDSGSAVRVNTGMQAAGDLTHLVVDTNWLPSYIAGTRMGRILQIAGQPLANSPLC